MRRLINWIDAKHNEGLYELMTNQIYTAVLGSIIYMLFDWSYTVYTAHVFSTDIMLRTFFLLIGIAFYLSDFYYIKGSNPYRKWYFILDLIFMICMLYSAKVLNVEVKDNLNTLPAINIVGIKCSYIIFLSFYLLWDVRELIGVYSAKPKDRPFYIEVIVWEVIFLLSLILCKVKEGDKEIKLLLILLFSTIWFCIISSRKAKHVSFISWTKSLM